MRLSVLILLIGFATMSFPNGIHFQKIGQWEFDRLLHKDHLGSIINQDGDLIGMFSGQGVMVASKKGLFPFAQKGQGPGEILNWINICTYQEDGVGIIEMNRKTQVFRKTGARYQWVQNIWREERDCVQIPRAALFLDNQWFLGGPIIRNTVDRAIEEKSWKSSRYVRILDRLGHFVKELVKINRDRVYRTYLMDYFLVFDENNIYFLAEDQLTVHIIKRNSLTYHKKIELDHPDYYRGIPDGFYSSERRIHPDCIESRKLLARWKTEYSAITKVLIFDGHFGIQIRTADKKLKRFALILYKSGTFRKVKELFGNDLLLAVKSGKFYFLKGGDPAFDDEFEDFTIDIYGFTDKDDDQRRDI